jgi:hypothetical protein
METASDAEKIRSDGSDEDKQTFRINFFFVATVFQFKTDQKQANGGKFINVRSFRLTGDERKQSFRLTV